MKAVSLEVHLASLLVAQLEQYSIQMLVYSLAEKKEPWLVVEKVARMGPCSAGLWAATRDNTMVERLVVYLAEMKADWKAS